MNDTLKVAGRIGAELGAAKAEVERLRGEITRVVREFDECDAFNAEGRAVELMEELRAALSQQAEPTDTYTAVDMATAAAQGFRDGQAAVEPAPAQDEQAVAAVIGFYEGEREPRLLSWNVLPNGEHRLYTRPAQTEQRTDKALSDFNAWWDRQPFRDQFEDMKQQMANVWVASRAELVVTIDPGDCFSPNDCGDLAIWRDDAKRLLEAAGVTMRG